MLNAILTYLHNCCSTIENAFVYISSQDYLLNPIEKIGGIVLTSSFVSKLIIEEVKIGKPLFDSTIIKEKYDRSSIMSVNKEEILKIIVNNRTLYFKVSEGKKKLEIYENDYIDCNPILELDIEPKHENLNSLKDSYIPLTIKELFKWYFNNIYKIQLFDNFLILFLSLISIKTSDIIEDKSNKHKNILIDLTALKKDKNFSRTFCTINEYLEQIIDNFDKLEDK